MKLNLDRPICFFDLEATGTNVGSDRIVEIAILKINPDETQEEYHKKVNPTIPIPVEVSEIHGIYDVDVLDEPSFADIASEIQTFIGNSHLAGFNSNKYDVPLLYEEFLRSGIELDMSDRRLIDVQNIFHKKEERTLAAAMQFYCNEPLEDAHSADADAKATYEVFKAQMDKYPDLKPDIDFLHDFSRNQRFIDFAGRFAEDEDGTPIFNFGKHKGKPVKTVLKEEPAYYGWMMNGDFPSYTKKVLTEIKESMS